MKNEIREYLKEQGILATDVNLKTLEEAKEFVKTLDGLIPSDEIIERCKKEGALEKDEEGNWIPMETIK